jgi:hypothetical protein
MATLASFLHDVLFEGRIHLHAAPADVDDPVALAVLRRAYDAHSLSVAGPMLPLDEKTALAAGRLLEWAAWYYLNPNLPVDTPEKKLCTPTLPSKPEQHLSADLVLRFLPTLHRRAQALMQNDALPLTLEKTLREWPLSGVMADIVDAPMTPVDFGDHAGLNFLYAERLAKHERVGWFPLGRGMQYVELVWSQLGKDVSMLPALAEAAQEFVAEPEA